MKRALLAVVLAACDEGLDQRLAIIDEPRVLAVVGEPAEAKPGTEVAYRAVIADPEGPVASTPRWSYCLSPKPPTEDNAVPAPCVRGEELAELGTSLEVTGELPVEGCLRYGPETPPGEFRPRDADPTGGYYQPIRVDVDGLLAFGLTRITCKLPSAPADLARRYDLEYVANTNPTLDPIAIATVPANSEVTLTASWPAAAVETYLFFDRLAQDLIARREAMRVSWFATGGELAADASLVDEADPATSVSTIWRTPAAGTFHLWFVLRDSRGGLAVQDVAVTVE
jgi:hypothetical protein